jgi:hypothetical protein
LLQLADLQPEPLRWHARQRLESVCRELFGPAEIELQAKKRACSRAGSPRIP